MSSSASRSRISAAAPRSDPASKVNATTRSSVAPCRIWIASSEPSIVVADAGGGGVGMTDVAVAPVVVAEVALDDGGGGVVFDDVALGVVAE
jgi:hypothetical protein